MEITLIATVLVCAYIATGWADKNGSGSDIEFAIACIGGGMLGLLLWTSVASALGVGA